MKKLLGAVILLLMCLIVSIGRGGAEELNIFSPSEKLKLQVNFDEKKIELSLQKKGNVSVCNIFPGIKINGSDLKRFELTKEKSSCFSETWKPVWGKQSEILNDYKQLTLFLKESNKRYKLNIIIRLYDDGLAFRYEMPKQEGVDSFLINDLTKFEISEEGILWAPNGENHNLGPLKISVLQEEEITTVQTPMVVNLGSAGFLAVHEAATFDFAYSLVKPAGENSFAFDMEESTGIAPAKTSWRVFMTGEKAGDLLESNILYNLNPPCAIKDTSWIKPGVALEDWRSLGAKVGEFSYSANQESYRRYIDFAAEKGIEYVLFSAWWYNSNGIRFTKDGMDLKSIVKYAENKGVGVILYIDRIRKEGTSWKLEDVLKEWHNWGVKGIKYGFLRGECKNGRQELVIKTREIVELCAKYKMVVDFHDGPVPPSGDSRTWPNLLTREYCHAQSDSKRAFQPKTFVTSVLVNGVSGALDMSNGYFELNTAEKRAKVWEPIPSTVVAEAARAFIVFSGLIVLPDHPDAYHAKDDLFNFLAQNEGSWDETKVLKAKIGEYIVVARRKGDLWMVGAATNEKARELQVNFDFLKPGKYKAKIYADTENTSAHGDKESYCVTSGTVSKNEVYTFKMAPGGGHCVIIDTTL